MRVSTLAACGLAGAMMALLPFCDALVAAFGVEPSVVRLGGEYLRILLCFNVPMAIGIVLSSGLRGAGDVRTPLLIGALMNVVNVAARVESLNRELGSSVLATEEVWRAAESDVQAIARHELPVRGRVEPVRIWQLA